MDKLSIGIPEEASKVWASEVAEIAFRVVTTDQLRDLFLGTCLPFHTSLQSIGQYRLLIHASYQGNPFFGLLGANILAMIRASRRSSPQTNRRAFVHRQSEPRSPEYTEN